jgi:hypothetical protein
MPKKNTATSPRNSTTTSLAKYSIPTPGFRLYKTIIKTGAKKTEVATKITTVKTTKTAKTSTAIVDVKPQDLVQPAPPIPVGKQLLIRGKRVPSQVTDSRKKKSQSRQDHGNNPRNLGPTFASRPYNHKRLPTNNQDLHNELIRHDEFVRQLQ